MAVIDFFDRGWRQNRTGIAYRDEDRSWTYDAAYALSCQVARALLGDGFAREAKAAVLSPNDSVAWICVLGIWRACLAWVPLNPANTVEANRALLDGFDCEVLFFHSSLAPVVDKLRPSLPGVRRYVCLDVESAEAVSLASWVAGQPPTDPKVAYDMDDVVAVSSTGGTTGLPKGVMCTHRNFASSFAHMMLAFHYPADAPVVNLVAAPMTHAAGTFSMSATARGGTVVILPKPEPAALLAAIERHRVTEVFLVPTVIYRLLESPDLGTRDLSSLRYLIYGAAPMSTSKLARAIEALGPVMIEVYGQMEAHSAIAYLRPEEHFVNGRLAPQTRLASCGRPYPLIRVEVRDADGRPVPTGQPGEICVRGDLVMKGYYRAPDKTAQTIIDGWLHTGDIGHLDEDGYLHITDRAKDMLISGGYNVYPSEIEQVLWTHPAVQDCAVIGIPHPDWGEAVHAVVELRPGRDVTAAELIALCKRTLGSVRSPKSVEFVASLPRSANGKVLKKAIRELYWSGEARQV